MLTSSLHVHQLGLLASLWAAITCSPLKFRVEPLCGAAAHIPLAAGCCCRAGTWSCQLW